MVISATTNFGPPPYRIIFEIPLYFYYKNKLNDFIGNYDFWSPPPSVHFFHIYCKMLK